MPSKGWRGLQPFNQYREPLVSVLGVRGNILLLAARCNENPGLLNIGEPTHFFFVFDGVLTSKDKATLSAKEVYFKEKTLRSQIKVVCLGAL